jgi:hypothetical protein
MSNIFNDGFTNKSFLYIYKQITENLYDAAISAPSNKNKKYNTKGLKFNYIEVDELNACVWIDDDYDNMRINTGTVSILYAFFYTVFSNTSMFVKIGDANGESNNLVIGSFNPNNVSVCFSGAPKDENRRTIANLVSLMACRYVCMHELGHLLNGHSYLLNNLYGTQQIEMILKNIAGLFKEKVKLKYALDRRTLEMDADSFAATNGINNIIEIYQAREETNFYFDLLENPFQIFELWTFAVHSIFMLFESYSSSSYDKTGFYLPNEAREMLNLSAAQKTIDVMIDRGYFKCSITEKENIMNHFYKGIREAEIFFNTTFKTNYDFIGQGINDSRFIDYADEVLDHWNKNLRNKLEKYSRAILYNPTGMDY